MKTKLLLPIFIVTIVIGVFVGDFIAGDVPVVNGMDNPNYEKLQQLEKQIGELQSQIKSLEEQVALLQDAKEDNNDNNSEKGDKETTVSDKEVEARQKVAYVKSKYKSVNVRQGAGTNFPLVTKVYKGSPMLILDEKDKWYRIKLEDGRLAWVANWIVDVKEE